jgi:hypothetical protein
MMPMRAVLVDASVFCRAFFLREYKGIAIVQLLQRLWEECYAFIISERLLDEYRRCIRAEGFEATFLVHRFMESMGPKAVNVDVSQDEIDDAIERNPKLEAIDEDVPHLIAAQKGRAEFCLFIEEAVECRAAAIKRSLNVNIKGIIALNDEERGSKCTDSRIPIPFP